jgi:hypothetical protein
MTAQNPPAPSSKTPIIVGIIAATLVAIVLGAGGFLFAGLSRVAGAIPTVDDFAAAVAPEPFLEISPAIVTSVQEMAQLTTVEMTEFTIVEKGTDQGWLQWARGDTVRLMAVANIGAGVDLAGIGMSDFSVSEQGIVEVNVPNAEIHYIAVDHEATQILDREKGVFTKGDPQLESEAREIAETVLLESALQSGILAEAETSARIALTNLLKGLGYTDVIITCG